MYIVKVQKKTKKKSRTSLQSDNNLFLNKETISFK